MQPILKKVTSAAAMRFGTMTVLRQVTNSTIVDPKYKDIVGDREVVGFGMNGDPTYHDNVMFPFPSIRFKVDDPHLKVLREKEKGDWKKLSIEEKKQLYRASFRQTFEEMTAPTGEYKSCIGFALIFSSLAVLGHIILSYFIYDPLPSSFSEESRAAQLRRVIDLRMNPISGPASKWDYENDTWKTN